MQSTRPGLAKLAQSARILKEFVHPFLQNWQPGMKTSLDYKRKVLPRTSGVGAKKQSRFEILQITASGAKICVCPLFASFRFLIFQRGYIPCNQTYGAITVQSN